MIRRIFAIWPPAGVLAFAGLIYAAFQAFFLYFEISFGVPIFTWPDTNFLVVIMIGFVVMHAVYRVAAFHPAYRADYNEWLCGTPWTSRKPLPLGPIHLVWQDALLLAIAIALAWPRAGWSAVVLIHWFLVAYLLALGLTHLYTGQKMWGYAVLFGLGFAVWFARDLPIFLASCGIVYLVAYLGLRFALAAFPWQDAASLQLAIHAFKRVGQHSAKDEHSLGWPYDRLGPHRMDDGNPGWDFKLVWGVLMGWWLFVVHHQFRIAGDPSNGYVTYYMFLVFGIFFYRLLTYCNGYMPPLDLRGRLATGRLIIPGYDQVFVAPLFAVAVGVAAWYVPRWFDVDPLHITSVAFVLTWWILFAMPPSVNTWRLTGNHHITPGLMKSAQQ